MELQLYSLLFQLLGIIVAIIGVAYIYLKYVVYAYWRNTGIPQAKPTVPFGSMWPVLVAEKSIGELMRDLYLQFKGSSVFGFYSFHKPSLVIRDPDLIRFVLTKQFSQFDNRGIYHNEEVDPLSGNLFMLSGVRWRHLRTKFSPTFTSGKMKYMFAAVKECSDNLTQCMEDATAETKLVEMKDLVARFSTDVIASVAFGIECNSLRNPDAEFRALGRKLLLSKPIVNTLLILCPPLLKLFEISTIDEDVSQFIINTFKETVAYRTNNNVVRKDFLDLVMQLMNNGYVKDDDDNEKDALDRSAANVENLTMLEGAAQVFAFWLAGFETSSSATTHCLYELTINQDIQDKVADEIHKVLHEFGGLTYESANAMSYLNKVINETLRKYPSLPILNRECTENIELPGTGLHVTKGTSIVIPVMGLHSDPDIYPDPEKFDPERFNENCIASRHRYAYLPFGEGPRNCIGMRFGLLQMKIVLISLLSQYRFLPGPDTEESLKLDPGNFLLCSKNGVTLEVERR